MYQDVPETVSDVKIHNSAGFERFQALWKYYCTYIFCAFLYCIDCEQLKKKVTLKIIVPASQVTIRYEMQQSVRNFKYYKITCTSDVYVIIAYTCTCSWKNEITMEKACISIKRGLQVHLPKFTQLHVSQSKLKI